MKNKKGFVLLETLVVTVFALFIFTVLYNSAVPLLGKYEEISYYNDIDTTYALYHLKKLIVRDSFYSTIKSSNYTKIECNTGVINSQLACINIFSALDIDPTKDEVVFIKNSYFTSAKTNTALSEDLRKYLDYIKPTTDILVLQNDGYLSYVNLT